MCPADISNIRDEALVQAMKKKKEKGAVKKGAGGEGGGW